MCELDVALSRRRRYAVASMLAVVFALVFPFVSTSELVVLVYVIARRNSLATYLCSKVHATCSPPRELKEPFSQKFSVKLVRRVECRVMDQHDAKSHEQFLRLLTANEPAIRAYVRRLVPTRQNTADVMQGSPRNSQL